MALNFQDNGTAPSRRVLVIVLVVISLALTAAYSREGSSGPIHSIQNVFTTLSVPFKITGAAVSSGGQNVMEGLGDAVASEETLSSLRERNLQLTQALVQAEEYRQEALRLEGLLNLKDTYEFDGVTARVIGRSTDAWNQTITIAAGSDSGIGVGQTVMGPYGVVGQVLSVSKGASTVRLLTDAQSGAAALIQSSRAEGVVRGSLDGLLYLEDVDADTVVNVGDIVITSGLGGSYKKGLLIGTVVSVEGAQGDATRRIVVSQNSTASMLEEVIVVTQTAEDGDE